MVQDGIQLHLNMALQSPKRLFLILPIADRFNLRMNDPVFLRYNPSNQSLVLPSGIW